METAKSRRNDTIKAVLTGHSGCSIHLMEDGDGRLFVRKKSNTVDYNKRLEAQCEKQRGFSHPVLLTPRVLSSGYDAGGMFFFDMEYVKGIALSEFIKNIEVYRMKDFIGGLIDNLLKCEGAPSDDVNDVFLAKIQSLRASVGRSGPDVDLALNLLERYDWSDYAATPCHGDLTLENIMVKGDDIYLIDFLDSFYDNYFLDIGKILQDVVALWSYRHDKAITPNTLLRLKVFKDLLIDCVAKDPKLLMNSYYALLLHLVRILPYAKDDFTIDYVRDKIRMVLRLIES